jgi:hypothetical protein
MPKQSKLKVGDLCYLKDIGFPYDSTHDGGESWEGASCVVRVLNAGLRKNLVDVELLLPIRTQNGRIMHGSIFHQESVLKEDRPWLKKHVRQILKMKTKLREFTETVEELL